MPLCRESLAPHLLPHLLLDSIMACFEFPPVLGWALGLLSRGASLQISSICSLLLTWSQLKQCNCGRPQKWQAEPDPEQQRQS